MKHFKTLIIFLLIISFGAKQSNAQLKNWANVAGFSILPQFLNSEGKLKIDSKAASVTFQFTVTYVRSYSSVSNGVFTWRPTDLTTGIAIPDSNNNIAFYGGTYRITNNDFPTNNSFLTKTFTATILRLNLISGKPIYLGITQPDFYSIGVYTSYYQWAEVTKLSETFGGMPQGLIPFASQYGELLPSLTYNAFYPNNNKPLLTVGESISSPNGRFRLTLQIDGNLVLYKKESNTYEKPIWWTNTHNSAIKPKALFFQTDGHLVLYSNDNIQSQPIWYSRRYNRGPIGIPLFGTMPNTAFYALQNDGNFVFYWTFIEENQKLFKFVIANTNTERDGQLSLCIPNLQ